jgi:hypothetical protein
MFQYVIDYPGCPFNVGIYFRCHGKKNLVINGWLFFPSDPQTFP